MDFKKMLIGLGSLIGVLILFFVLKGIFFKDEVKPVLANLLVGNQQVMSLSREAQENLDNFELKVLAANLSSVLSSDNLLLSKHYQANYGKNLPKAGGEPLKELQAAPAGSAYDSKYQELVLELRNSNARLAQQLLGISSSAQLNNQLNAYLVHLAKITEEGLVLIEGPN